MQGQRFSRERIYPNRNPRFHLVETEERANFTCEWDLLMEDFLFSGLEYFKLEQKIGSITREELSVADWMISSEREVICSVVAIEVSREYRFFADTLGKKKNLLRNGTFHSLIEVLQHSSERKEVKRNLLFKHRCRLVFFFLHWHPRELAMITFLNAFTVTGISVILP